jgi:hypothetical protein
MAVNRSAIAIARFSARDHTGSQKRLFHRRLAINSSGNDALRNTTLRNNVRVIESGRMF